MARPRKQVYTMEQYTKNVSEGYITNDAICITDLQPDSCDVKEWTVKPMRRQSKAKTDRV